MKGSSGQSRSEVGSNGLWQRPRQYNFLKAFQVILVPSSTETLVRGVLPAMSATPHCSPPTATWTEGVDLTSLFESRHTCEDPEGMRVSRSQLCTSPASFLCKGVAEGLEKLAEVTVQASHFTEVEAEVLRLA